jgi:hypothetical protein
MSLTSEHRSSPKYPNYRVPTNTKTLSPILFKKTMTVCDSIVKSSNGRMQNFWKSKQVILLLLSSLSSSLALQPSVGHGLLIRGFLITHNDAPQSVGVLCTSDQLVAETSTWQHTTDKHPCPRWDFFSRILCFNVPVFDFQLSFVSYRTACCGFFQ